MYTILIIAPVWGQGLCGGVVSAFSFLPAVVRVGPHCGRIARPRFQIECAAIGQPKLSRALGKCPSAWRLVASAQTANILL